ncbi:hypothetical protein C874_04595 [Elizabethkingia anophelis 502]|nr:hypothetical protein C874_04595 [Elizabethkingia anophelis 502]
MKIWQFENLKICVFQDFFEVAIIFVNILIIDVNFQINPEKG